MQSKRKWIIRSAVLTTLMLATYGSGRLYYHLTGGFTESNIIYEELPYESKWEVAALSSEEKIRLQSILAQEYHYLGKGCQSYVFSSQDDQYVIKFFKYQRFRPQPWWEMVGLFPWFEEYRQKKIAQKKRKLDTAFASWKLAYEELQEETGVCYVHFNKSPEWQKNLVIYDKLGLKHTLPLDQLEFMVQKKGTMLCDALLSFKAEGNLAEAKQLIDRLLSLILSEYQRGYADNDHALMQNTGIFQGRPMHIDVGQFIKNSIVKDPQIYRQELYSKMWKFRHWLHQEYPALGEYTESQVAQIIGPAFHSMQPELNKGDVARIPFE